MASDDHASGDRDADDERDRNLLTPGRIFGFIAALALSVWLLPMTEADRPTLYGLTGQVVVREQVDQIGEAIDEALAGDDDRVVRVDYNGPVSTEDAVYRELSRIDDVRFIESLPADEADQPGADAVLRLEYQVLEGSPRLTVHARLEKPGAEAVEIFEKKKWVGRWHAALPPLIAVLIALFFRRLLVALATAVWLGATIQTDPFTGVWMGAKDYVWGSVADTFSLYIIAFTFSLVGMVQVITRMGGMRGVLNVFAFLAKSARSTQVSTALVGLAIFFDDYANTIVTGTTMRPLADKMRISREKLAYIVDSTSAPIAGLAIISTWIGYEVGLFDVLAAQLDLATTGYDIFFQIIPLRFYCIFALAFVFMNALSGRDFGPMLAAERRARETGNVLRPGSTPLTSSAVADAQPAEGIPHRAVNAVVPVATVIGGTLLGMFWSGWQADGLSIPSLGAVLAGSTGVIDFLGAWGAAAGDLVDWSAWRDAFSNADNAKVLFWAALTGSVVAVAMAVGQRLLSLKESLIIWLKAIPAMWLAVAILVLAWSIQGVCSDLGTSVYLVGAIQDLITPAALPVLTFALAAVIAFATGTSWGTMGILLPAIIPLAFFMTRDAAGGELILMLCFGAVLDGAIFGDHCSPISDTTVMSSIASAVDHIDHVRTQFPYAMTVMLAAAGLGYIGVAMGLPVIAAHLAGIAALASVLWGFGKKAG